MHTWFKHGPHMAGIWPKHGPTIAQIGSKMVQNKLTRARSPAHACPHANACPHARVRLRARSRAHALARPLGGGVDLRALVAPLCKTPLTRSMGRCHVYMYIYIWIYLGVPPYDLKIFAILGLCHFNIYALWDLEIHMAHQKTHLLTIP
jgi:hypothetical protein